MKNLINNFRIKLTSRRERLTYWLVAVGFAMYLAALIAKASIIDTSVMFGAIAAPCAYYLKKETDRESTKDM